jgi:alkylated DNA repair protein alkB family protein 8
MDKISADKLLKLVHDNYKEIAVDFNLTRKKEIWPELIKLATEVKDGDKILDLGCGNGRLIEALKNKKIDYLGIDNSEELIKLAQINYPNNKFLVSDILNLENVKEISSDKFDHIFCLATLQHLPGRELRINALNQMKNLLARDGRIVVSNWNMWPQKKYRKLIFKTFWEKIIGKNKLDFGDILFPWKNSRGEIVSQRYYHAFRKNELLNLAKDAGFNNINIYQDKYNYWLICVI